MCMTVIESEVFTTVYTRLQLVYHRRGPALLPTTETSLSTLPASTVDVTSTLPGSAQHPTFKIPSQSPSAVCDGSLYYLVLKVYFRLKCLMRMYKQDRNYGSLIRIKASFLRANLHSGVRIRVWAMGSIVESSKETQRDSHLDLTSRVT